jgi:hypothetical protein
MYFKCKELKHACNEKASDILKQIYANKETWEFKPYTE